MKDKSQDNPLVYYKIIAYKQIKNQFEVQINQQVSMIKLITKEINQMFKRNQPDNLLNTTQFKFYKTIIYFIVHIHLSSKGLKQFVINSVYLLKIKLFMISHSRKCYMMNCKAQFNSKAIRIQFNEKKSTDFICMEHTRQLMVQPLFKLIKKYWNNKRPEQTIPLEMNPSNYKYLDDIEKKQTIMVIVSLMKDCLKCTKKYDFDVEEKLAQKQHTKGLCNDCIVKEKISSTHQPFIQSTNHSTQSQVQKKSIYSKYSQKQFQQHQQKISGQAKNIKPSLISTDSSQNKMNQSKARKSFRSFQVLSKNSSSQISDQTSQAVKSQKTSTFNQSEFYGLRDKNSISPSQMNRSEMEAKSLELESVKTDTFKQSEISGLGDNISISPSQMNRSEMEAKSLELVEVKTQSVKTDTFKQSEISGLGDNMSISPSQMNRYKMDVQSFNPITVKKQRVKQNDLYDFQDYPTSVKVNKVHCTAFGQDSKLQMQFGVTFTQNMPQKPKKIY